MTAFRQGLSERGYLEGQNVRIEYRWAEGRYNQLPALAADLLSLGVAVLVAQGGDPPPMAAKSATATIPIVFTCSSDPVKLGLVRSLNQPGGNVTGFWGYTSLLGTKRLELIQQLIPAGAPIIVLMNPDNPNAQTDMMVLEDAARISGQPISFVGRARTRKSTLSLPRLASITSRRFSSILTRSSWRSVINLCRSRRIMEFPRFTRNVSLSRPAA